MKREEFLDLLFEFYMSNDYTKSRCIFGYTGEMQYDDLIVHCKMCDSFMNYRCGNCFSLNNKWYREKVRNILRKEGYID